jgi:hypothetical protein
MAPVNYTTERQIAAAAETIAPLLNAMGVHWADWNNHSDLRSPGAAEVAMTIRSMVAGLAEPGHRVECGCIAVEWRETADDDPDPEDVRIFVHIRDVESGEPERADQQDGGPSDG